MISAIVRTALVSLRRDRGALALSFILPVVFFSIFAVIFGGRHDTTSKVHVLVVDEAGLVDYEPRGGVKQPPEFCTGSMKTAATECGPSCSITPRSSASTWR